MKRACLFLASVALQMTTGPVFADSVFGTWLRDNGKYQVRFEPCGDAVCGDIVWLKPGGDTEAKIGQRIFFDMKPDGANSWVGKAKNPADGTTYSGKFSMTGNSLTTEGCVIGGLICKSMQWSRVH